jgi:hypothetical protein
MSAISTLLVNCPVDQGALTSYWQDGRLGGIVENIPYAEFLTSDINRREISMRISPGGAKIRNVEVTYMPRFLESTAGANVANPYCGSGTFAGNLSSTYTLDTSINYASAPYKFTAEDLEGACMSNPEYVLSILAAQVDVVDRRLATVMANQAAALYGSWGSGIFATGNAVGEVNASSEYVAQTLLSGGQSLYPMGWQKIDKALSKIGMLQAAIFTGDTLDDYYSATVTGCCTDSGIDISAQLAQYGKAVMYDRRISASGALNSENKALAVMPGALQWIPYTRASWKMGTNTENIGAYYHSTIRSPRLGIDYDVVITDDCGEVTMIVIATGKTIAMPSDMYTTGDIFTGVTGVAKILVTNP